MVWESAPRHHKRLLPDAPPPGGLALVRRRKELSLQPAEPAFGLSHLLRSRDTGVAAHGKTHGPVGGVADADARGDERFRRGKAIISNLQRRGGIDETE